MACPDTSVTKRQSAFCDTAEDRRPYGGDDEEHVTEKSHFLTGYKGADSAATLSLFFPRGTWTILDDISLS